MKNNRLFGGILLISGTTIGAGMLALPISTGIAGYFPALIIFIACWLLMYWTACLFLEVNLCFEGDINLITMAKKTLGPIGAGVAWFGFLLLLYTLLAAYMAESGRIFFEIVSDKFGFMVASWMKPLPIVVLFGPFVYVGFRAVDYINRYLMIGLVVAYVAMVVILSPKVEAQNLAHVDMDFALLSFAVVITSFGYHIIIPSLTEYLARDVVSVKRCIFWGSLLPMIIYVIWETLILGSVPAFGDLGLAFLMSDHNASLSGALELHLQSSMIAYGMRAFGLFAIITSFLGVAQSLFDFLRDGFKIPNSHKGRALVWLITFMPPLAFVLISEKGFVTVIEYAGVIVAVVIGLVPIMMTWSARYIKKLATPYRAFGGKAALMSGFMLYILIVVLAIAKNLGWLNVDVSAYLT